MSIYTTFASIGAFASAYSQSDFFGKLIFLGLFVLSVICWVVLIHKIRLARKIKKMSHDFEFVFEKNKDRLFHLDLEELHPSGSQDDSNPFVRIFLDLKQKTIDILNKNHFFISQSLPPESQGIQVYLSLADLESVESHVLTTVSSRAKHLEKNLFILSTIATLAPFLGLLGTVWGILITFSELNNGASASSNSAMLGGLSTALTTTVLGLLIAIPALVSYNYLKSLTKTISSDMYDFLYKLLSQVELQYRKTDVNG
jgi:biopolymer transport protein TolQ